MKIYKITDLSKVIDSPDVHFNIEAATRVLVEAKHGGIVQQRWKENVSGAIALMRRTLEIATLEAKDATAQFKSETISDWKKSATLAKRAKDATHSLVEHLASGTPRKPKPIGSNGKPIPNRDLLVSPLRHMRFIEARKAGQRPSTEAKHSMGRSEAKVLCEALTILDWIANYSIHARNDIAGGYQNPGSPQKLAFAKRIMEGWIFLTGKKPSAGNATFADFVSKAWDEVCLTNTDWTHAIREAAKGINRHNETGLADQGPSWK